MSVSIHHALSPDADPFAPAPTAPGKEDNLLLLDCRRCQEPRYHLCRLAGSFPLANYWQLACGECGYRLQAWEDVGTLRWPSDETNAGIQAAEEDWPDVKNII